jgi:elongation factor P
MTLQKLTDLRLGVVITIQNAPYMIVDASFMRTAQRKPVMRTKLRNLIDGRVIEQTFKPGDKVESADLGRAKAGFLYDDGDQATFMDSTTYDQFTLPLSQLESQRKFLREGLEVDVLSYNGKPVAIDLPKKIEIKVIETVDAVRGDTAQGSVLKDAKLETGFSIKVPMFVKTGEMIRVNTETELYVERV